MKQIAFLVILATLCSLSFAQPFRAKDLYSTKAFKDASFNKINVKTSHGDISVTVVPANESKVEVYIRPNSSDKLLTKEDIQRILDEYYSIELGVSGDLLSATANNKKTFINGQNSLSISFRIFIAKNISAHLRTSHGNVDLVGLEGSQDVETSHGDLHLENITGKLDARTSHGNISVSGSKNDIDLRTDHGNVEAKDCEGTVKLTTSNGNIDLEKQKGNITAGTSHGNITADHIQGDLAASTSHGDVTLEGLTCSVDASTHHGNIRLAVTSIKGDIVTSNSSGNISLKLPKGKGLDVDFRGKSVNLDMAENFSGTKEKDSMKGTLNGGGTKVKAKTDQGNVSVTFGL